jgi:hypothetical protein
MLMLKNSIPVPYGTDKQCGGFGSAWIRIRIHLGVLDVKIQLFVTFEV